MPGQLLRFNILQIYNFYSHPPATNPKWPIFISILTANLKIQIVEN